MLEFSRSVTHNFYANFLTLDNKEAVSIVDPKITIRHVNSGGTTIIDVNEQPMNLAIETLYYFKWMIPADADLGVYTVEYQAVIDSEYAEANEMIEVVENEGDAICLTPLTTKEKVAEYLGTAATNIKGDWLEWTKVYIENFTCQKFCPVTVTEKYDIEYPRQSVLILENNPLITLVEVKDDGEILDLNDLLVYEDEGVIKFSDDIIVGSSILRSGFFTRGRQKVHVTYKYGYPSIPKDIEWCATVLAASIASTSLTESGVLTGGNVEEQEIGEYRVKFSSDTATTTDFSSIVENSKEVNGRIVEDIFSAKNVLRMYRTTKMRSV